MVVRPLTLDGRLEYIVEIREGLVVSSIGG